MVALAATVRRLVAPVAWTLALVFLMGATATLAMFMPERIDHHGWQLAMLAVSVAGLCDPRGARGGALVGVSSAVSLTIGLELLPYAVSAGGIIALRWVWDRSEAERLRVYALTLAGGAALGFAAFASYANRVPRCDALTPVWLSAVVAAGALLFAVSLLQVERRGVRLALVIAAGGAVAAFFGLAFPQCLGRPEQVSQELYDNWLSNVREAKPIYRHPLRNAIPIAALPIVGVIGAIVATWRARRQDNIVGWASVLLCVAFAAAMLLWQMRAGPAAQLMAIPGAVALGWVLFPWLLGHKSVLIRVFGTVGGFVLVSGLAGGLAIKWFPIDRPSEYTKRVNRAGARCNSLPQLARLDRALPAQTAFTFNDLGPRLIVTTHLSAIGGPYHRNGAAILDVQHAFKRSPEEARAIMLRHGATVLLTCPDMAESTIYRYKAKAGFYDRLARGERFAWLTPVPLWKDAPFRAWRVL